MRKISGKRLLLFAAIGLAGIGGIALILRSAGNAGYAAVSNGRVTVSSIAELAKATANVPGGTTIRLLPGTYPAATIKRDKGGAPIVITSADTKDPARIGGLNVRDSSGLTFTNVVFLGDSAAIQGRFPLQLLNSSNIRIENSRFSGPASGYDPKIIAAAMIRASNNIVITGCRFERFWHGLSMLEVKQMEVSRNEFSQMRTDGIRGGGVDQILIAENVLSGYEPAPGDHPDGIQLWSTNQKEPGRNIVIRDNLVARGTGAPTQGVFVRDTHAKLPFENVEIKGNLVIGSLYNGIAIDGVRGARIIANEVIAYPDRKSWIRVERGLAVEMSDNAAMTYVIRTGSQVVESRNQVTSPSDSNITAKIAAWLDQRPQMRASAGPLLKRLAGYQ